MPNRAKLTGLAPPTLPVKPFQQNRNGPFSSFFNKFLQTVEDFTRYFKRSPDQLGTEHIREYQAYLFRERKLAARTVTQRLAALPFFFIQTIKKGWSVADTPYPKETRHLPSILSPEEVARLIDSSRTRFHRLILMALYGTGMRRAELARLQIFDIDSRRIVVHIRGEKGRRDRDVMLSPVLLEALRDYWRGLKRKPTDWLFPGGNGHIANCPITPKTIYYACCQAAQQAGLQNGVHPHTLRHSPGQKPNEVPGLHLERQPASQTFISLGRQDFVYGFSIGIQPAQELVAFVN